MCEKLLWSFQLLFQTLSHSRSHSSMVFSSRLDLWTRNQGTLGTGVVLFCKGKRGPGNEAVLIMHTVVVINAKSAEDAECEKLDF